MPRTSEEIDASPSSGEALGAAGAARATNLIEVKPGYKVPEQILRNLLPDVETAVFFAKTLKLDYHQLGQLITILFDTDVVTALLGEAHLHSSQLQGYIVDVVPPYILAAHGNGHYDEDTPAPDTELLAQLVESATVKVADSIQKIADSLGSVLGSMSSKYGQMTFAHLAKFNAQRNAIGSFNAQIVHQATPARLVIFDVSGSVSSQTVRAIADEIVGLAYAINASLAIVSDTCSWWEAGTFDTDTVLDAAEYGGTHYEMLVPVLNENWDTVVTIADYDSSESAQQYIRDHATGTIGTVQDISLVNRPSFLAECVGQLASKVEPIIVGNSPFVVGSRAHDYYG